MTGSPLDTSGQKWTQPGMFPIVREAIVATAATTLPRAPLSVSPTETPETAQFVDTEHCLVWKKLKKCGKK